MCTCRSTFGLGQSCQCNLARLEGPESRCPKLAENPRPYVVTSTVSFEVAIVHTWTPAQLSKRPKRRPVWAHRLATSALELSHVVLVFRFAA